jgi:hypothetical protein
MPVLISNQTSNTTNNEQQEQIYNQEENGEINNHVPSNEPEVKKYFFILTIESFGYFQVDLLRMLDEPIQTNGVSHQHQTLNPLEDLLFGNGIQTTNSKAFQNTYFFFIITKFLLAIPPLTALNKNGLRIIFTFEREGTILTIHAKATNSTQYSMTNFIFKAAVPRVNELFYIYKIYIYYFRHLILNYIRRMVQQFLEIIPEGLNK